MRIVLIADAYVPARTSVAVQMRDLARELKRLGHEPTVIVPSATLSDSWQIENLDGVEIVRLKAFRTKDVGLIRRALSEFLLSFVMLRSLSKSPLAGVNWDGIVWYSPTIFFGPLVRRLKRKSRCPGYLILRDLFPDWAVDVGLLRKGIAYRFLKFFERMQYSVADTIGVQSPANLAYMKVWSNDPGRQVEVLNNWLSPDISTKTDHAESGDTCNGRTVLVYAGNMGVAQDMDCMIELAKNLRENNGVALLFVGRGSEVSRLKHIVADESLDNVEFRDEVDPKSLPDLLSRCHIGLLSLDKRHKTHNIPGKFLTYLHAGLPVLAQVNAGNDLVAIIRKHEVGFACVEDSSRCLKDGADALIASQRRREEMGQRARLLANRMFSAERAANQILSALK